MLLLSVVFNTCPFFVHIYQLLIEMTKSPKVSSLSQRTLLVDQCSGYIQSDSDVCSALGFVYTWGLIYHVTFPTNMVSSRTCSAVDSLHVIYIIRYTPWSPLSPGRPMGPGGPCSPFCPFIPSVPLIPGEPGSPLGPITCVVSPRVPLSPLGPCSPDRIKIAKINIFHHHWDEQ